MTEAALKPTGIRGFFNHLTNMGGSFALGALAVLGIASFIFIGQIDDAFVKSGGYIAAALVTGGAGMFGIIGNLMNRENSTRETLVFSGVGAAAAVAAAVMFNVSDAVTNVISALNGAPVPCVG